MRMTYFYNFFDSIRHTNDLTPRAGYELAVEHLKTFVYFFGQVFKWNLSDSFYQATVTFKFCSYQPLILKSIKGEWPGIRGACKHILKYPYHEKPFKQTVTSSGPNILQHAENYQHLSITA